jgi:hypothetical protein
MFNEAFIFSFFYKKNVIYYEIEIRNKKIGVT